MNGHASTPRSAAPSSRLSPRGGLLSQLACIQRLGLQLSAQQREHTGFYFDDPLTVITQWPQGNTCLAVQNATGNCTQGGFPVYVVNVTSVKHVQAAVNFARNNNVRVVIK
ncbi:hypothetical protein B0T25DRAFT_580383 [Lasiosphaeria hispida]|uniref:Uncharacterized protein n=1 Tax=Lasiosphaeria hispida TaxID=260671 RepID=A0AAJ0MDH2_9PEZI|nr:hypothetical protein B0T25DRAFT_580383 [Lasiosphaeria hispida]